MGGLKKLEIKFKLIKITHLSDQQVYTDDYTVEQEDNLLFRSANSELARLLVYSYMFIGWYHYYENSAHKIYP